MPEHAGQIIFDDGTLRVLECECCGWRHLDPLPDPEEHARLYRESYHTDGHFERVQRDEGWYRFRARRLLRELGTPGRLLLDVGCGDGLLPAEARIGGWTGAVGIEPSAKGWRRARARGLAVFRGELTPELARDLEHMLQGFDAVVSVNTLEHVLEPELLLRLTHRLLLPGGRLLLVVPRDFSVLQTEVCQHHHLGPWWVHPTHLHYWTPESLTGLLWRVGFEVWYETTSFPLEVLALGERCYVGDPEEGRRVHEYRMAFERSLDLGADLDGFYDDLARHGRGREIVLYARKVL